MSSLSDITTVARSGILTQQERLNVIAHNITNVDTAGYHRQVASLTTNPCKLPNISTTRDYAQGTGVTVADITREYDLLRERAVLGELSDYALNDFMANQLPDIESIMQTDTQNGLAETLTAFWTAWQDVASYPDNESMRAVALEAGVQLAAVLNKTSSSLASYAEGIATGVSPNINGSVTSEVDRLNIITQELQTLNHKITLYENTRVSAGDLEDRRDVLVSELAQLADVSVDAGYHITLDGQTLVSSDGLTRNELTISSSDPLSFEVAGTPVTIESGTLGGWGRLVEYIDSLSGGLDTLASELITQINALHTTGYDLDGNPGMAFFTGSTASDMAVNSALYNADNPMLNKPRLIAAAKSLFDPGGPNESALTGDGSNALAIADLSGATFAALDDQSFNDYYSQLTSALGAQIESYEALAEDGETIVTALRAAIQSESGVSLDEELVSMITAQRAYQAAANLLTQTNTMFDVIMSITR